MWTFHIVLLKQRLLELCRSWAKNKVRKTLIFAFKANWCVFYIWLSLILSTNRHAGKMVVPFTGCAQQSRSESSYSAESVLSTNLLSLAQQAFCPVHSFLVLFKELDSEQLRKREGHLKPDTGRRRAEPPPAPVPRECPVGELSAEAWCERRKPAETEQYWWVILSLLHEIVKRMIDGLFPIFIFSHNINTV